MGADMPSFLEMLQMAAPRAQFTQLGVDDVGKGHSMHPFRAMSKRASDDGDYASWKTPIVTPGTINHKLMFSKMAGTETWGMKKKRSVFLIEGRIHALGLMFPQ